MGTLGQLVVAALAVSALVVLLSVLLAAVRAGRIQLQRRRSRLSAPLRPAMLALAAGEDPGSASDLLSRLDQRRWKAVEPAMLTLIGKVRGAARSELVEVLQRRDALRRALADTRSRRALRRAGGADRLGLLEDAAAAPRIIELLCDRSPQVRRVAARAASRLPCADTVEALLGCLAGPRLVPAGIVAQALLRIGTPAVPALRGAVRACSADAVTGARLDPGRSVDLVAATAVDVLGLLRSVEAVEDLIEALRRGPARVSVRAARALGRVGAPAAVGPLLGCCAPSEPGPLRMAALDALAAIGDRRVVTHLSRLLDGSDTCPDADSPRDAQVARAAAHALAALGAPGEDVLRRVAASPGSGGPDGDGPPAAVHAHAALDALALARSRSGRRGRAS